MRLMLLRHASAKKAEPCTRDLDRALNARGRKDAAKIGWVIVSPARRAERDMGARVQGVFCAPARGI
jgi:phosphohistidine phosphatase SixA